MSRDHPQDGDRTAFERRVVTATLAAGPLVAVVGTIAMLLSPNAFAESDSATGAGLWLGAALGLAMFLVFSPLPQLLFGLALRSGTLGKLTATVIAASLWAVFFGLLPLVSALTTGWTGVAPVAVIGAGAAGVLDCFVFVAPVRGIRRLRRQQLDARIVP